MPLDTEMLDAPENLCQSSFITDAAPPSMGPAPFEAFGGAPMEIKIGSWGGSRHGAGRPRKPVVEIVKPAYVPDIPLWCVVAFFGQAEMTATTELTRQGYETYLPMVAVRRRDPVLPTMWRTVRVPYFSGYGFIRLTQTESREPIMATRGIREVLLRPDGRAASVPDRQIETLRADDARRLVLPKEHGPVLGAGRSVRLNDGPFTGHTGTVVQCDGVKTQVSIEVFGRHTPVWLDRTAVSDAA